MVLGGSYFRLTRRWGALPTMDGMNLKNLIALCALTTLAVLPVSQANAREALGSKWRFTSVKLDGAYEHSYFDGTDTFSAAGKASYRGGHSRKAFEIKLSKRRPAVIIANPIRYAGSTQGKLTHHEDRTTTTYDCSYTMEKRDSPVGLTAVLMTSPNGIRIQWSFVPPGWRCMGQSGKVDADFFPILPTRSFITKHPLKAFASKKVARLPIRLDFKQKQDLIWSRSVKWSGHVVLERLPR